MFICPQNITEWSQVVFQLVYGPINFVHWLTDLMPASLAQYLLVNEYLVYSQKMILLYHVNFIVIKSLTVDIRIKKQIQQTLNLF